MPADNWLPPCLEYIVGPVTIRHPDNTSADHRKKTSVAKEENRPQTCPVLKGPHGPVPYIALWSGERTPAPTMVASPFGGIAYPDETPGDRDSFGVLWTRVRSSRGKGAPVYDKQHALRQRETMESLLCQVCAAPADHNGQGTLWLLHDYRRDWPGWPEGMANSHPPLCLRCANISVRHCPSFGSGFVALRAHSTIIGVSGALHRPGTLAQQPAGIVTVRYDDPARQWVRAALLLRELHHCTVVEL